MRISEREELKQSFFIAMKISLIVMILLPVLYAFRILPLPAEMIINHENGLPGGFITCQRLQNTHWFFTYSSGEYFSPTPIYDIRSPSINMRMITPYCPQFTPPPYD